MIQPGLDDSTVTGFEFRFLVRHVPALLHVEKVEGHYIKAPRGKPGCEYAHEAAQLIRPCSVTQDQGDAGAIAF